MIRLDTNYILRYFLNDNENMAKIAEDIILNNEVFVSNEVIAEVVYVLDGVYHLSNEKISTVLIAFVQPNNVLVVDKYMLVTALEIFKQKSLDFVDCILCAFAGIDEVLTFDKKLQKCIVSREEL